MTKKISGALVINKPKDMTSHDVVAKIRKIYNTKEVGHAGTLDPLATGILICLLGEATKLSSYVMAEHKAYRVGVKFGVRTDSGDITGKVIMEKQPQVITKKSLDEKVAFLKGEIQLPVPMYSAVKIDGKKLYEYARENIDMQPPVKVMNILNTSVVEIGPGTAVVDMECEKGTYVRSWVEKLGELVGCGATVESLSRTQSGPFDLSQAHSLDYLEGLNEEERQMELIPLEDVLGGWPSIKLEGRDQALVSNGQIPKGILSQVLALSADKPGIRLLSEAGMLSALLVKDPEKGLKLARVFNT